MVDKLLQDTSKKERNCCFPKKEKMCNHSTIEQLFTSANSMLVYPYLVRWKVVPLEVGKPSIELLISASTKTFKHATDRNRIKRLTREAFRQHKHPLYPVLEAEEKQIHLALVYVGKALPTFVVCEKSMKKTMLKLINFIQKKQNPTD